ncbi:MAG: hypothetical protein IPH00_10500 [Flavobacteriales bacterium]|nr:hypothetical protein [Flavobacteriales bacterium]
MIKKWDRSLAPNWRNQILHLYGKGTSYEDIGDHLKKMYGVSYSPIVHQPDHRPGVRGDETWRNRPLEEVYVSFISMRSTTRSGRIERC